MAFSTTFLRHGGCCTPFLRTFVGELQKMSKLTQRVKASMKSQDLEGSFELYVTRTPGYLWAVVLRRLHVHPIAVTLVGIVLGCLSGWFFYHADLRSTICGIALLVVANWMDCADGQLARMTGRTSLIGRILDGFMGDAWFFCIYFALCLRMMDEPLPGCASQTWGWWIWLLGAWAGLHCHVRQCAIGDYYRNVHLWFCGTATGELTTSHRVLAEYATLRWRSNDWFRKLYLFFYARYTRGQERQSPRFQLLYAQLQERYAGALPDALRQSLRRQSLPLMKWTNVLTFDVRVVVLFASLLAGMPWLYFLFESTVLEVIRHWLIHRHENITPDA